ncbi:MAG: Fe-S cluster assembly protein SufD [Pseudomonadota bacterium]|nr:Fe-S cluster assembly protein SufD [Pseudomonadota bacterium]
MSEWLVDVNLNLTGQQSWFHHWRQEAKKHFDTIGLPNSKQEWWRYAPLKQLFAQQFKLKEKAQKPEQILPFDAHRIICKNQTVMLDDVGQLPAGLIIMPLLQAIETYPERVKPYLRSIGEQDDAFDALNASMFEAGVWIEVPEKVKILKPILIHYQSEQGVVSHVRNLIVAHEQSSLQVIEYFDSADEQAGFINQVSDFAIQAQANCSHLRLQKLNTTAMLQSQLRLKLASKASFESFLLQLGGHYASCDSFVELQGEEAKVALQGVFQAAGQQTLQQRVHIQHQMPHCISEQNFRGILDEHAHGVFIGRVDVYKDAFKTEAHQSNKNLLLSKYAQMITCPELKIDADDVICSHGATVGQLDEDALFYLQTRGLTEAFAKQILVQAFIKEPMDAISNESFKQYGLQTLEH